MELKFIELLKDPKGEVYGAVVHYMNGTQQTTTRIAFR